MHLTFLYIDNLYLGKLYPIENLSPSDPKFHKLQKHACELGCQIESKLNLLDKDLLCAMLHAHGSASEIEVRGHLSWAVALPQTFYWSRLDFKDRMRKAAKQIEAIREYYRYTPFVYRAVIRRIFGGSILSLYANCIRNKDSNVEYQTMKNSTANGSAI